MSKIIYNYITTNILNGKQYVGMHSSDNVDDNYLGSGLALKKAIIKYGRDNFKREVLCRCNSLDEAFRNEKAFIEKYNTLQPNGYNLSPAGGLLVPGCFTNKMREKLIERNKIPISEETRKKMSNKFISEETRKKISIAGIGRKHSEEFKQKLTERNTGRIVSEETRRKVSEANKGKTPWNKGKKGVQLYTEDQRRKQSIRMSGVNHYLFGKHHSKEVIKKMSDKKLGNDYFLNHKHSSETKIKISNSLKDYYFRKNEAGFERNLTKN